MHELETANNDITSLLNCTNVATVFVDLDLRIRRFTSAATQLFRFVASDLGRPLVDITARFSDGDLLDDVRQVIQRLVPREKEVAAEDGGWWLRRIMPYRTADNRIAGAVMTFVEITERKRAAEEALRGRDLRLQVVMDSAADAIVLIDEQGVIGSVNPATEKMFGYSASELIGQNVKLLMPPPYVDEHDGYLRHYRQTKEKRIIGIGREVRGRRKDGAIFPLDLAVAEITGSEAPMFIGTMRDLSVRKALEREVLQASNVERQRIGRDLHDTTGQEVTALGLLANALLDSLPKESPEIGVVSKIATGLKRVLGQIRAISRGLIRVEVEPEGLMAALAELAAQVGDLHNVECVFDCPAPVLVANNQLATQLHCIASEAVANALKHAEAHKITISLIAEDDTDCALPIGRGQTISQPTIVAMMTEALCLTGRERVLEIGAGSGYQAAILAELAGFVVTMERHGELARQAADRLKDLAYENVLVLHGDGTRGCPERAPFERIIVTAAADECPPALFEQLAEGGLLVAPLGNGWGQTLVQIRKVNGAPVRRELCGCAFVPLIADESIRPAAEFVS